ncbi:MAG: sensor histidine kinase [Desulfovibrionaceae bacterium]|jgi:signal transduction histidine kinase|nr:sensor histidine kinase [Desulfovibrionaceae bacterium]
MHEHRKPSQAPLLLEIRAADRFSVLERRIAEKQHDFDRYQFTEEERRALNIFFDLSQEFEAIDDFYSICVLLPKVCFGVQACLYLLGEDQRFERVRCSAFPSSQPGPWTGDPEALRQGSHLAGRALQVSIRANPHLAEQLPFRPAGDTIGILELHADGEFTPHRRLFFEKLANRIGFQLCNKLLFLKNKEHIKFIRDLVRDIGHNVIVPNMYFKLLFKQLDGKIQALTALREEMDDERPGSSAAAALSPYAMKLGYVAERLEEQFNEIYNHYEQTSLFLETLLRSSHFEKGKYVLVKQDCDLWERIIQPQVDRFVSRFEERGIGVARDSGPQGDPPRSVPADVGLVSQVLANFFSNAVKYTRETRVGGRPEKSVRYRWRVEPDYFGPGRDGMRVEVQTTGPLIPAEDRPRLFEPEYRGHDTDGEYGTGHGLYFVRGIVALHGGDAGYEPWEGGNCFYFVLPLERQQARPGEP